jgi:multidrug efflux pump subunit AcrB
VLCSLLVARLLTPMMAAYLLKPHGEEKPDSRLMVWYLGWVDAALRHRGRTLWLATGLFVASLALVPFIPATFIPQSDLGRSNLNLELPPGTRLQDTVAVAERARALLTGMPELKQVYTAVGSVLDLGDPGATGVGEPRKATLVLDWGTADTRDRGQQELERDARQRLANLPGVRSLNLTVGTRWSDYSTVGSSTNSKVSLEWRPVEDLLLRGTVSEVFRAPNTSELYAGVAGDSATVNDPCNGYTGGHDVACANVPTDGSYRQADGQISGKAPDRKWPATS